MAGSQRSREAIQLQIQQDWANREYIEIITVSIKKITDFLNSFDLSCRSKLALLNEKLTTLERKIDYLEACVTKGVLNKVFNAVDEERRIKFGPNRACAEWLLRNGASVKFKNHSEYLKDYNGLPEEDFPLILEEVFADGASISHYGFDNFKGCKHVSKIQFHNCTFLENVAMDKLLILRECLKHLCISNCQDITDLGLLKLAGLKLATLELSNLRYVENKKIY
ncbi:hypothetical protein HHI36_018588 [Cryptolaemus montrouzieri]|uniref:ATP synthase subunit s, mitochondrial n=1 Tax=Cryptolaemus montrouzieri TaxID=559131 RepID=A0ABD2P0L4_9CUCU